MPGRSRSRSSRKGEQGAAVAVAVGGRRPAEAIVIASQWNCTIITATWALKCRQAATRVEGGGRGVDGEGAACLCVVSQFGYGNASRKIQRIVEGVAIVKVQGRVTGERAREGRVRQETGKWCRRQSNDIPLSSDCPPVCLAPRLPSSSVVLKAKMFAF